MRGQGSPMALPAPPRGGRGWRCGPRPPRARAGAATARSRGLAAPRSSRLAVGAVGAALGGAGRAGPWRGLRLRAARAGGVARTHPARSRRRSQRGVSCPLGRQVKRGPAPPQWVPHAAWNGASAAPGLGSAAVPEALGCGPQYSPARLGQSFASPHLAPRRGGALARLGLEPAAARRASPPDAGAGRVAAHPSPTRHATGAHHEARPGETRSGVRRALLT